MARIPVDEVITHLHGVGTEYITTDKATKRVTGGGMATLDIVRRADGQVSVDITFMFRGFEFRVPQQEWDRVMARIQGQDGGHFGRAIDLLQEWCGKRGIKIDVRQQTRCYVFANRFLYAELPHGERMMFDGREWHVAERIKF